MRTIDRFEGTYEFLSNFYPSNIVVAGLQYPTVEHAYQASKTRNPLEEAGIRHARTPGAAKRLGQKVTLRSDWEIIKLSVMEELLRRKFEIPVLRAKLLLTEDAQLIEGNWWNDTYWGVCRGRGENHLGRLLMIIRKELQT